MYEPCSSGSAATGQILAHESACFFASFRYTAAYQHGCRVSHTARHSVVSHCVAAVALRAVTSCAPAVYWWEPAAGNWEARNLMCTYGKGFRPLVDAAASSGWDFVNEGKPGAPKLGYISRQPGSVLKIRVNSMRGQGGTGSDSSSSERMNVMLAYLKSYEGMGMASFE